MHIGYFVSGWPASTYASGIVTYIDVMKRQLEALGHEVSIFCGSVDPVHCDANIHSVHALALRTPWARVRRRILAAFNKNQPVYTYGQSIADAVAQVHARKPIDVFEIEESFGWSLDLQALGRFPVVVRLHGPTFLVQQHVAGTDAEVDQRIKREGAALEHAKYISAPAECTLNETISYYGLNPEMSFVVPNPYQAPQSKLEPSAHDPSHPELLFVGRFDLVKGADNLLKVFSLLSKRHPKLRLIFAGPDSGLEQPDGIVLSFAEYSEQHLDPDVRKMITFLGRQTPEQIRVLRNRASVSVMTSRWENQPYTVLEAMAEKCPVAAFAAGGVAELVTNEHTGLSAPSDHVEELARQIDRLLVDAELRSFLAENAFRYVSTIHNPATVARSLLQTYLSAQASYKKSSLS